MSTTLSSKFGSFAEVKPASTTNYLKAYTINENVSIQSCEIKEGTSSEGNPWKKLSIVFGNEEGIYEDSLFWLDINDPTNTNRVEYPASNGGSRQTPSRWEKLRDKMSAIGIAFFPAAFKKFQEVASKFRSFDEMMNNYMKCIEVAIKNKTTNSMKLVGRNVSGRTYAALPNCTGIAQANTEDKAAKNGVNVGDWYTWLVMPFGDKLNFSAYEETQRDQVNNSKPTEMPNDPLVNTSSDEDEFDLEKLL